MKSVNNLDHFTHSFLISRKAESFFFFLYFCMTPDRFELLLELVGPKIEKKNARLRRAIRPRERVAITLRQLASGETQQSLSCSFRNGRNTVSNIISETCEAIFSSIKSTCLNPPYSPKDWKNISLQFQEKWNFPHTIGPIDIGECPKNSGTLHYNYKGFFSIVLLTVCDANYCFTLYNLRGYRSNNNSGIL